MYAKYASSKNHGKSYIITGESSPCEREDSKKSLSSHQNFFSHQLQAFDQEIANKS